MKSQLPTLKLEIELWAKRRLVIGIDEVGRGALAGLITVGAVCFPNVIPDSIRDPEKLDSSFCWNDKLMSLGINDSKKLSPRKREELVKIIKKIAVTATSSCSVAIINKIGIVAATHQAARAAVKKIRKKLHTIGNRHACSLLLDGSINIDGFTGIIHGDGISLSIAAASIIAKVARDRYMVKLSKQYTGYHWQENKGYGTKKHIKAIKKYGKTKMHRELFIRRFLTGG